ncbi:tetratricopeptide repeat protein [Noviherbaspirillum saxi]|uniref:tetratricopeptide repeat protein n=1 Tax=Noviherbaspirillum saxi TaxID=2320863 RepID=UPI001314B3E1|nr:hypothetical protein [Noviherbaspirillum saxi]
MLRHLVWCIGLSLSTLAGANTTPVSAAIDLHKKGQYEGAAARGLNDLLSQPWNHHLRFIVADSLQRISRIDEARMQLEALEGTAFADAAKAKLQSLRRNEQYAAPAPIPELRPRPAPAPVPETRPLMRESPASALHQLSQYQTMPPAGATLHAEPRPAPQVPAVPTPPAQPEAPAQPARSPGAQRVATLSASEKYYEAGTEGLALMTREKADPELQLIIANCLAWTGRLKEAQAIYQGLTAGKLANEARIGMANVHRWRGRDDEALPLYRAVLAADPANASAKEGVTLAQRALRPRTTFSAGGSEDSSDIKRKAATINHRWREGGGPNTIEVEVSGVQDNQLPTVARQKELTLRYHAPALNLKPSFELSVPSEGNRTLYGSTRLKFGDNDNVLELGRVNWGRNAVNPNALLANLSANHVGLEGAQDFSFGRVAGRLNYFDISDGNRILSGNLRLASNLRPLGNNLKPFVGVEAREAKFNTPNYWSPEIGFGSFYAGLLGEWDAADWNLFVSGQAGTRIYGDAGDSWSVSAGGKRWLSNDIGVGFNLWSMASQRDNAAYRSKSFNINLEKLW